MLKKGNTEASTWRPVTWRAAHGHYPQSRVAADIGWPATQKFLAIWGERKAQAQLSPAAIGARVHIFLVRGIFGNVLPGNFVAVRAWLRQQGFAVTISPVHLTGTIAENGGLLRRNVQRFASPSASLIFLCQSKGGLDTFWALRAYPELRKRTLGMVVVQTPCGPAAVMESILLHRYRDTASRLTRWREWGMKQFLSLPALYPGSMDLTESRLRPQVEEILATSYPFPLLSLATWSESPSSWLDSYHKRLHEIRPGAAHDGQFFLEDQLWPNAEQILLGHIDHSQSVMKGLGVDTARLWASLLKQLSLRL